MVNIASNSCYLPNFECYELNICLVEPSRRGKHSLKSLLCPVQRKSSSSFVGCPHATNQPTILSTVGGGASHRREETVRDMITADCQARPFSCCLHSIQSLPARPFVKQQIQTSKCGLKCNTAISLLTVCLYKNSLKHKTNL